MKLRDHVRAGASTGRVIGLADETEPVYAQAKPRGPVARVRWDQLARGDGLGAATWIAVSQLTPDEEAV